jgi:hypothetical protein
LKGNFPTDRLDQDHDEEVFTVSWNMYSLIEHAKVIFGKVIEEENTSYI